MRRDGGLGHIRKSLGKKGTSDQLLRSKGGDSVISVRSELQGS